MSGSPFAGVNHIGYVVTDLVEAGRFFTDILGFERVEGRVGKIADPVGELMTIRFGLHPRATGEFAFFRSGSLLVELLEWDSPDQIQVPARNSDVSGRHLAMSVPDVPAAVAMLSALPNTEVREPNDAGYIYVKTSFGLELQLIPVQE